MPVRAPPDHTLHDPHARIRLDARLDATTRQKVDDLASHFHQPRAAVLCHIMQWGISCGPLETIDQDDTPRPVRHLYLYVASDVHARMKKAAVAVGVNVASWLRHIVCQITVPDFPASWQEEQSGARSHDSRNDDTRFMLRLGEASRKQLQYLVDHFHVSKAQIIRQLIEQATPEDFPKSWQMKAAERRTPARPRGSS